MEKIDEEPVFNEKEWRRELAGMAMQNMVGWYITSKNRTEQIAMEAVAIADALIAELKKGER